MAIDGRINIDVLFHDTDGTTSLKVVSLEDSTAYTTGKVAIVTGTCGTTGVSVSPATPAFKNAAGQDVTFSNIVRFAFRADPAGVIVSGVSTIGRSKNDVCVWNADGFSTAAYSIRSFTGTASYTLVLYGS